MRSTPPGTKSRIARTGFESDRENQVRQFVADHPFNTAPRLLQVLARKLTAHLVAA
jgi:hypothetical protein